MQTIRDQHAFGVDVYPKTLQDAYELLENHSSTDSVKREEDQRSRRERELLRRNYGRGEAGGRDGGRGRGGRAHTSGFQFVQNTEIVAGSDGRVKARIKCFKCDKFGHYSDFCPTIEDGVARNIITDVINDDEDSEIEK